MKGSFRRKWFTAMIHPSGEKGRVTYMAPDKWDARLVLLAIAELYPAKDGWKAGDDTTRAPNSALQWVIFDDHDKTVALPIEDRINRAMNYVVETERESNSRA